MNRSGVVLAGGASRRFGSDKLATLIDGSPLLGRSVGALAGLVDEIVIVGAPDRPGPAAELEPMGTPIRLVVDPEPFGGPLVGLHTGLAAARGSVVVVVGSRDFPSRTMAPTRSRSSP